MVVISTQVAAVSVFTMRIGSFGAGFLTGGLLDCSSEAGCTSNEGLMVHTYFIGVTVGYGCRPNFTLNLVLAKGAKESSNS